MVELGKLGEKLWTEQSVLSSQEGIYRAAFPAFRVFIYGQEVSGDVIDVRVNQSGGSMDRAPSTCSITLHNPLDKYIIDHTDMVALSDSREQLVNYLKDNVTLFAGLQQYFRDEAGEDVDVLEAFFGAFANEQVGQSFVDVVSAFNDELRAASGWFQENWEEGSVPDSIKKTVVEKKATQYAPESQKVIDALGEDWDAFPIFLEDYIYTYPFTEGDCIFHPNDPIRIAFRDPFVPTIWYWMFSGFVDGFTEDVGVNQESTVTIVGTDVSKTLRYSYFQLNVDAGLDKSIQEIFKFDPAFEGAGDVAALNWVAYQELFAHFTAYEILEMLFFGKEAYEGVMTELTNRAVEAFSDSEVQVFLQKHGVYKSLDEINKMTDTQRRSSLEEYLIGAKQSRFQGSFFPPVYAPHGVTFKRKEESKGVYAYYIGDAELDGLEKATGSPITMGNLRQLNDMLHSRVRVDDLTDMAADETSAPNSDGLGVVDVVSIIGSDIDTYPVGGGRVFYVAPTRLGLGLSAGVMNEMVSGAQGDLHSDFRDRLTYIYDLAEQIQFCFYSTGRGDLVFEMPFYDFDPWMFDGEDSHITNAEIEGRAGLQGLRKEGEKPLREWVSEWSAASGDYTESDILEMMELSSDLQLTLEGFGGSYNAQNFNYSDYFTINRHETFGFSSSLNDNGLKTLARIAPNNIARVEEANDINSRRFQWAAAHGLVPLLGVRPAADKGPWTEVTSEEAARLFAAVELRKTNAEARNIGLQTLPHFGLMVNRPLYWRQRNYVANIVSCQHSMVVNSACDTTVNVNLARGWKGVYKEGTSPKLEDFQHFGGETPFNYARLLSENAKG